jgi:glycosyltransferase involved in cell wall biosynthesis
MKITILSTAYPLRGGIAHFIGLLYKELSKSHEVNVITFKRQYPSFLFPGKTQLEGGDTVEKIDTRILVDSINPLNWFRVGKLIKRESPDLLVYKYWMPFFAPCFGTISRIAKKNGKTKVLTICDNVFPHERKPGDKAFTNYFFKVVDYFVLLSEKVKEDLIKLKPGAKNEVLQHPVYSNFGEAVSKEEAKEFLKIKDEKLILFFGFIRDYKGLDVLFDAMAELKNKINVKLVVAGEFYSNKDKYKKLIDDLGIEGSLYLFTDFIPTSEVKYYFSATDAVILPYKDATQSGIVQIAMNFKKPVIAANAGGLGEVIHDDYTGFIVKKENPKQLADAILRFYKENKEHEFVNNISKEVEKYSWSKFVEGIIELLQNN